RTVIGHRHRQKMVLNIRKRHTRFTANETTGFEVIGRPKPFSGCTPLRADPTLGQRALRRIEGNRLFAAALTVSFEMILQSLADVRVFDSWGDPVRAHLVTRAATGKHENLRRIDSSCAM